MGSLVRAWLPYHLLLSNYLRWNLSSTNPRSLPVLLYSIGLNTAIQLDTTPIRRSRRPENSAQKWPMSYAKRPCGFNLANSKRNSYQSPLHTSCPPQPRYNRSPTSSTMHSRHTRMRLIGEVKRGRTFSRRNLYVPLSGSSHYVAC